MLELHISQDDSSEQPFRKKPALALTTLRTIESPDGRRIYPADKQTAQPARPAKSSNIGT